MPSFKITGGLPLGGTVRCGGSKNAALPMMAASILADGPVRLEGVPRLTDVRTLALVLGELGVEVRGQGSGVRGQGSEIINHQSSIINHQFPDPWSLTPEDDGLLLETVDPTPVRARYELVRRMRASFCVLGPLLARRGKAVVSLPGGCKIGNRPVDLHLGGLAALGADLRLKHGYVVARAPGGCGGRLLGTTIDLSGPRGPTVTGTANVLSAAVLARGTTTITGAAREPEIVDLGNFLNAMGARITGLGTSTIRVEGVDSLGGTSYRVIPDRIEAATLLLAAAITRGSATVTGVVPEHLTAVLQTLRSTGARIEQREDHVRITADGPPRRADITGLPYPGIPSDVQAQFTALLSLARGRSTVRDAVFPNRFVHLAELNRLGARIEHRNSTAIVTGVSRFTGASVTASDLRASAALVLAGLAAEGQTIIHCIHHLDRGYQRLDEKLKQLGARIERDRIAAIMYQ